MKKVWLVVMVVALALVAGAAFAGEPIKLGMSTWLGYAPLYLAKEKGFFQKRGGNGDAHAVGVRGLGRHRNGLG